MHICPHYIVFDIIRQKHRRVCACELVLFDGKILLPTECGILKPNYTKGIIEEAEYEFGFDVVHVLDKCAISCFMSTVAHIVLLNQPIPPGQFMSYCEYSLVNVMSVSTMLKHFDREEWFDGSAYMEVWRLHTISTTLLLRNVAILKGSKHKFPESLKKCIDDSVYDYVDKWWVSNLNNTKYDAMCSYFLGGAYVKKNKSSRSLGADLKDTFKGGRWKSGGYREYRKRSSLIARAMMNVYRKIVVDNNNDGPIVIQLLYSILIRLKVVENIGFQMGRQFNLRTFDQCISPSNDLLGRID